MTRPRILLVEDDEMFSIYIVKLLEKKFNIIKSVPTGEEAIDIAINEKPDLILMDILLSGEIDGIEAASQIKKEYNIPIIYLTVFHEITDKSLLELALETKPDGYIKKQTNMNELPLLIELVLNKHQAEKEKLKIEDILKDSEEKFRSIATTARDGIIFIDNDGNISFWNQAAEHLCGYTSEESLGKNVHTLIGPDNLNDQWVEGFESFKKTGKGPLIDNTIEFNIKKKDRELIPVEISFSSVMLKGKWCCCGIIRDISERIQFDNEMTKIIEDLHFSREAVEQNAGELVRLNSRLAESEERLSLLNASKDKFFSIISHDLKNPFQALLGYSEILSKEINKLNKEKISEFAKDLHDTASHVFKLLENLLQWSRIQRGIIEFHPENFQLSQLVDLNIKLLNAWAKQKNIQLESLVNPEIYVYADLNMINTITRNLLSNAIKFTPNDGKISVFSKDLNNSKISVTIKDSGVGMKEEDKEKLFRIDYHHTTEGTANEKGTGLGLILCKDLIDMHSEKIFVDSKSGKGTSFTFTLKKSEPE
jgi:PAS domain S-box-containing protein